MRRRDVVFLCVAGGLFLAALAWALTTQARWVQESKPIEGKRPALETADPESVPEQGTTGVTGTVTDDTREAMTRALVPAKPAAPAGRIPTRARQRRSGDTSAPPSRE